MTSSLFMILFTVLTGVLFLAAALIASLRSFKTIPKPMQPAWLLIILLVVFFLAGYLGFLFLELKGLLFPVKELTASIFFGGALFVFLMISVALKTIGQLAAHEHELSLVNQELVTNNLSLEAEISRRAAAEKQAANRLQHLASLHAIDTVISSSLDLGVTLKIFLEQLTTQLNVDAAAVLLFDPHTQTVAYSAGRGFTTSAVESSRQRLGQGCAGRAAFERKICHVADLSSPDSPFERHELVREENFVSYCAMPLVAKGQIQGVLEIFHRSSLVPDKEWFDYLEALAVRASIAIDNATLFHTLQRSNTELILSYDTTIEGWGRALELRDTETSGHTERVTALTREIARRFGIGDDKLVHIIRGALLHDIGKMAISDAILMKDGPLSEEERQVMQQHPVHAFNMLSPIPYLQPALDIPYCHHEHWDGSGYPRALAGKQIPLAARIFSVADNYDALVSRRRYHESWTPAKACSYIASKAGSLFDPEVVEIFLTMEWCTSDSPPTTTPKKISGNVPLNRRP